MFRKRIPVLMYHRLAPPDRSSSLTISPESFVRQLDWLERHKFDFLSLDGVVARGIVASLTERVVALTFDDGFQDNYEKGLSLVIRRGKPAALFVVADWVGKNGFLSWDQIRELANAGVTIGSHSLTHRWLPDLSDDAELEREVVDSKKRVEDEIGRAVNHFGYPVGGVDERVAACVRRAGYRAAWVAGARPSSSVGDPRFALRRVKVTPSDASPSRFAVKAYGLKGVTFV